MAEASSASRAVDFFQLTEQLKRTPRTGWVNHGVDKPESIADHMYRMSLMAMVAAKSMPELDQDRCVKLALIHDLAEAIVGDITPHDPVTKEEKRRMESDAMRKMRDMLGDALGGEEIRWTIMFDAVLITSADASAASVLLDCRDPTDQAWGVLFLRGASPRVTLRSAGA